MKFASGADTAGLKQIDSSPLIVPAWIASMISWAGMPLPGISASSQPHTLATCGAVLGVGDVAVAGELVALVAVLAAALAVALPGDRRHAAAGLAELAGGQPEVDRGEHVVDALGLLLDARGRAASSRSPTVPHHSAACSMRAAGTPVIVGRPRRGHVGDGGGGLVEVDGVGVDELVVEPVVCGSARAAPRRTAPSRCPGRTGRNRSAVRASGTTRGSCTISLAPRSRARQM